MSNSSFRRYTTLPYLFDILYEKRLALLDPSSWDDKNDSHYLELYRTKKGVEKILALCFAEAPEAYPHWKIYAGNTSGVCIEFDKDKLTNKLKDDIGFLSDGVRYKTLEDLRNNALAIDDLPFIKRYAFLDEHEYRFIYKSSDKKLKIKYIPINLDAIKIIVINPWIEPAVYKSVKSTIERIVGRRGIQIRKSTVTGNDEWKKMGMNAI